MKLSIFPAATLTNHNKWCQTAIGGNRKTALSIVFLEPGQQGITMLFLIVILSAEGPPGKKLGTCDIVSKHDMA